MLDINKNQNLNKSFWGSFYFYTFNLKVDFC